MQTPMSTPMPMPMSIPNVDSQVDSAVDVDSDEMNSDPAPAAYVEFHLISCFAVDFWVERRQVRCPKITGFDH